MRISALPYFPGMKRAWSAMGLLLSVHALHAQPFFFERITESDGLPNREVLALLEDRDGHIWAGTGDGLARLEGTRIRVFHHDHGDSTSLVHDQVNALAQDDDDLGYTAPGLVFASAAHETQYTRLFRS